MLMMAGVEDGSDYVRPSFSVILGFISKHPVTRPKTRLVRGPENSSLLRSRGYD